VNDWIAALSRAAWHRGGVVLVDGRSGAGKSTLAAQIARLGPPGTALVHLDDFYPGWRGLQAAARAVPALLGANPRYRRWDWDADRPAELVGVPSGRPLVIEGSGAVTAAATRGGAYSIWVDAPEPMRRYRALVRDGEGYARSSWWAVWTAQEIYHERRDHPRELADAQVHWGGERLVSLTVRAAGYAAERTRRMRWNTGRRGLRLPTGRGGGVRTEHAHAVPRGAAR
jgi:energy-coupling factor transporter ATP-binding protein EcfA2